MEIRLRNAWENYLVIRKHKNCVFYYWRYCWRYVLSIKLGNLCYSCGLATHKFNHI